MWKGRSVISLYNLQIKHKFKMCHLAKGNIIISSE